jgi:hypothetical protein
LVVIGAVLTAAYVKNWAGRSAAAEAVDTPAPRESESVDVLTTTDGRSFKNAKVLKVEGQTVLLAHSEGVTQVPLSALSDEARKSLGMRTRDEQAVFEAQPEVKAGLELVAKLSAAHEPLKRSIIISEAYTKWENDYNKSANAFLRQHSGTMDLHEAAEMRYDGRRYAVRMRRWGTVTKKPELSEANPSCNLWMWDGSRFYGYAWIKSLSPDKCVLNICDGFKFPERELGGCGAEAVLRGYYHTIRPVEEVLAGAQSLRRRDGTAHVGGSDCCMLEVQTKYGSYVLWIDPAHGYNVARAEIYLKKGDLQGNRDLPQPAGFTDQMVLENVRFEEVHGVWVPMEADIRTESKSPDGTSNSFSHVKRTDVKLNPDFEALGSFLLPADEVREGTTVYMTKGDTPEGSRLIPYVWRNGKPALKDSGTQRNPHP